MPRPVRLLSLLRLRLLGSLIVSSLLASLAPRPARATEIEPPAPLSGELASTDARALLARWLGHDDHRGDARLVGASTEPGIARASPVVGVDGAPALRLPFSAAAALPPLPIAGAGPGTESPPASAGPLLAAAGERFLGAISAGDAPLGSTRFDVRPAARNPIELGGDVLDEVTSRVVRTPEPATLALFSLGAGALALAVLRRRRRARTP